MKKAGAISSVTKARLLEAGKIEFLNNKFDKASLRNICKNAEVTTGALYFFFRGKEDLFSNIISVVTKPLYEFMLMHYESSKTYLDKNLKFQNETDYDIADFLIKSYFEHTEEWKIIFKNVHQIQIERLMHNFIDESTNFYFDMVTKYLEHNNNNIKIEKYSINQFVQIEVFAFINLFSVEGSKEVMYARAYNTVNMLRGAFYSLIKCKE